VNGRPRLLVVGIGNELFTDEGIGPAAARRLVPRAPADVEVLDGGTLGLRLLPEIEDREGLLLLDAVVGRGLQPGNVVVLEGDAFSVGARVLFSAHQAGIPEALAAAGLSGRAPARVAAVGMAPASLATGYGLSVVATRAMDEMLDRAMAMIEAWGGETCSSLNA
jgi:hydrogenase maturation protease